MSDNIIQVHFGDKKSCVTRAVYQWDQGQRLRFCDDLPSGAVVEFDGDGDRTVNREIKDGMVAIPDRLLQYHGSIKAYLKVYSDTAATTTRYISIPVTAREKPSDYISSDDDPPMRNWVQNEIKRIEELVQQSGVSYATDEEVGALLDEVFGSGATAPVAGNSDSAES